MQVGHRARRHEHGDTNTETEGDSLVEYGIEDHPPVGRSVLLGIQNTLPIGANIVVPLVLVDLMEMRADVTVNCVRPCFVARGSSWPSVASLPSSTASGTREERGLVA
ncbi:hypothetical protein [Halorhabdus salina]|uniref:hypothetical protein n=1 Tax=Halorhabdus salina TaxID=2750670 RepID=UPI0015EEF595|nr:hypothetical protein [Halorhabdus salina]